MYRNISDIWKRPKQGLGELWRERLMTFRREPTIRRIERPTRLDRARSLGYKAKQGYVLARVSVMKGMRKTPKKGGRRPKRAGRFFTAARSDQVIAEQKAARKFPNCEVLNSYWVAEDGTKKWFEVILVDYSHPATRKDKQSEFMRDANNRGRAFRGLTSAGKKSRGLRNKGRGAEKLRPSRSAAFRRKASEQKKA